MWNCTILKNTHRSIIYFGWNKIEALYFHSTAAIDTFSPNILYTVFKMQNKFCCLYNNKNKKEKKTVCSTWLVISFLHKESLIKTWKKSDNKNWNTKQITIIDNAFLVVKEFSDYIILNQLTYNSREAIEQKEWYFWLVLFYFTRQMFSAKKLQIENY